MEYRVIQRVMNTERGIPSQCVTARVVRRTNSQALTSMCLKINAKLGVHDTKFLEGALPLVHEEPTIAISTHISYPRFNKGRDPAISFVVVSLDRHSSAYAARWSVQDGWTQ
ncbi:hypothetical protein PHYSODRAFT_300553 [Phytophthora sojae]|uniref:Piwi domain-containing protein n=1 Tax=Phytophthora sojae (strain P6497) TaxID=1094619 RepID=G4ZFI1_PHYSP|nr:hypothetical protein PHYSODRAFT_300550 [Phytophthora sojae]XP_009526557.1 hypothetical protein PHYSODRAFT_300553 [Phytophthora sojae]EGZ17497.1 hypothetical protein PHYSODRAFT_300550 [Phytophthora sojae]EGZ17499.1 hypothetical protein PHYSODRAFT_300553 [Phytophthora sojae]|eukprot:XP_009526555.1 hypothetical protein PHYSODRAFT_300550 [Phytophthora sojae]